MTFKRTRPLRKNQIVRDMVAETHLDMSDMVYPLFIVEGEGIREEIPSMKEVYRYSLDRLDEELDELVDLGINKVILFGIPKEKDDKGSQAYAEEGIIQRALRTIKKSHPDIYLIADLCMCEYTDHGHCGILDENGYVKNDETLDYLAQIALAQARAGADMIAPSDMMDGRIAAIRKALDENSFAEIPIMAYSAKYASSYYGPFRDAADSSPSFGDRKSYQMDYRNSNQAMIEHRADIMEGADIIMVKPALAYLDIIYRTKEEFDLPLAAYNVSGEYSMIKNAIENNLVDESIIIETLTAIKRAGAKIIITYFAKDLGRMIKNGLY